MPFETTTGGAFKKVPHSLGQLLLDGSVASGDKVTYHGVTDSGCMNH
jgi:hypothetical protein